VLRSVHRNDVPPLNRPKWNTILDERKGNADEQEQAQRGADYRRAEAGGSRAAVEDLAREYGCPSTPSTPGNRSTVALDVKEAQEVKQPREENARLKKVVADLSLDKDMLQSVIRKNSLGA
jgi:putative transposase